MYLGNLSIKPHQNIILEAQCNITGIEFVLSTVNYMLVCMYVCVYIRSVRCEKPQQNKHGTYA